MFGVMTMTAMTPTEILSAIISILVGGITDIGSAIGAALSTLASSLFLTSDGSALSVFAILLTCFAAVSLGFGLCRWIVNWISSWGSRNR